jgi:hypothetical protein
MEIPLRITPHDFRLNSTIESDIRNKAAKLEIYL